VSFLYTETNLVAVLKGNYMQLVALLVLAVIVFAIPIIAKRRLALSDIEMGAMDGKIPAKKMAQTLSSADDMSGKAVTRG
jgi:hypothetical protein